LLADGEVVALPTETVYGLAGNAFNPAAVAKIFAAKERPSFDPLIVHIGSRTDLDPRRHRPEDIQPFVNQLADAFWPGPLTLILPKHPDVPDLVTSGLPTVAVRQSAHPVFRAINKALGQPIAAPSANRFGRISPTSATAVHKELHGRIPLIIDGGACSEGLESTILAITPAREQKTHLHHPPRRPGHPRNAHPLRQGRKTPRRKHQLPSPPANSPATTRPPPRSRC
jgi:L-threonylcarbamoyladenylate synthase